MHYHAFWRCIYRYLSLIAIQCKCKASAQGGLTILKSCLPQEPHGPIRVR